MLDAENKYREEGYELIVGIDEAGRGPLAGPVYVAAVVFPADYKNDLIDDSKKLSHKKRSELVEEIKKNALSYSIIVKTAEEIDDLNIYRATQQGMIEALKAIDCDYDLVITDAMPLNIESDKPIKPTVKADANFLCVAAASILAKEARDNYMIELSKEYPEYSFEKHKGYGTKKHMEALDKYGPIDGIHRKSFKPVADCYQKQLKLF